MSARLSDLTTFRLGGPCRRFFDCATPDELRRAVKEAGDEFLLIGGGSNLLAADAGTDAIVIRYDSQRPQILREGGDLIVSGSTRLDDLARFAVEEGLEGLTCCTGIPGTVGGAVAGNAGAFGEQIGDRVSRVTLLSGDVSPDALGFGYRRSTLQHSRDIVVSVRLALKAGDRGRLVHHREEILALRASKHPDWRKIPTAGSFFTNVEPTSNAGRRQAAGWFLEQAGAKELRVGGARTYEKHANIVIAETGCTARDVFELTQMMADAVRRKFSFDLQREVRLIGKFDE